jgi:hypothetical protein
VAADVQAEESAPRTPPSVRPSRTGTIVRGTIATLLLLILSGALVILWIFLFRPETGEELTIGLHPPQYYADFDPENLVLSEEQYQSVWAVAHNSGGDIRAVLEGLLYGADIVEMDVVEIDGVLYSAHNPPLPILGPRWFRGPSLDLIWAAAGQARGFMFDLKQSDPAYLTLVADFIRSKRDDRPVFVASRDPNDLRAIARQAPQAVLLMSVPDRPALDELLSNDPLINLIDGVTIRQTVIDEETAARLSANDLMIFAWVVNGLGRVNDLLALGVDGITSDNLAILNLLGGEAVPEADTNPGGATPAATPGLLPNPPLASPPAQQPGDRRTNHHPA